MFRIQEWDDLDPDRTGFLPRSLDKDFGYGQIAETVYQTPLILLSDNGETTYVGHKSAKDLVDEGVIAEKELEESRRKKFIEYFFSIRCMTLRVSHTSYQVVESRGDHIRYRKETENG